MDGESRGFESASTTSSATSLLLRGELRRIAIVPAQTSADVRVDSRPFPRDLVCESVQLPHLLKQRLELLVVYRAFFVDQAGDVVADVVLKCST